MMNAAFRTLGLDWRYLKLPVPPERFEETVRALPGSGYRGANVTVPHKLAALRLADEASPAATAIGAANTLSFGDGAIAAENTDAGGLLDALGDPPRGALFVFRVDDPAQIDAFVAADPYVSGGIVTGHHVAPWNVVI